MAKKVTTRSQQQRRARVMQSDVPSVDLDQALRIPGAVADHYASEPTTPLNVAAALNMQPTSGPFRTLCGASVAYGLTAGGYNSTTIEITSLGNRVLRPTREGDELVAKREALLKPRVVGEFLRRYDGSPLPKQETAITVLEDMSVPRERGPKTFALIRTSAESLGLLKAIKGREYVALDGEQPPSERNSGDPLDQSGEDASEPADAAADAPSDRGRGTVPKNSRLDARKKRVFVAHGKNTTFLNAIKKLLSFGELEPVVSAEQHTVSQPVPDKVLRDMRNCGAAIIHVGAERILHDDDAKKHVVANENVLIEIGAAMALYGRRFILLVDKSLELPSNLQGLYEVRYQGDQLDSATTISLLEAIHDIKNNPLPDDDES